MYAELLPAGHHSFVLHDVANDKFYMHDFLLGPSKQKVVFPVKEKITKRKPAKVLANAWRPWLDDAGKDVSRTYSNDVSRVDPSTNARYF